MNRVLYPKEKLEDIRNYVLNTKRAKDEIEKKRKNIKRLEEKEFIFENNWDMERTNEPYKFMEEINWNFYPKNDPEWTYMLNRHKFLEDIAQLYLIEGNKKYYILFKKILKSWLKQEGEKELNTLLGNYQKNKNIIINKIKKRIPLKIKLRIKRLFKLNKEENKTWRTIDVALRIGSWLKVLEAFEDELRNDKEFFNDILKSLHLQTKYLLLEYENQFRVIYNWGIIQNTSLYLAGIFFEDSNYIKIASERLQKNLELQISKDGMQIEQSPMYHNEVLLVNLNLINILKKTGKNIPEWLIEKTKLMLYASFKLMKPNGNQPMLGDSDDTNLKDILTLGAIILEDSFIKNYAFKELDMNIIFFIGGNVIEKFESLISEEKLIENKDFQLIESGNFILRSGWKEKDNYLLFHNGFYGGKHSHSQRLHIELQNRGEDVLIDSGRYTYTEVNYRRRLKEQISHNTLRINKKDVQFPVNSWDFKSFPILLNPYKYFSKNYEYIEQGYLENFIFSGMKSITRKILYIKPDIYVIIDQVIGKGKNLCEQYFHFDNKGVINLEPNKIVYETNKNITELYFLDSNINLNLKDTMISKEYNKLEKTKKVITSYKKKNFISLITIIKLNSKKEKKEIKIEIKKIYNSNGEQSLVNEAQGIYINYDKNDYIIAIRNKQSEENRFNKIENISIFGEINIIKNMKEIEKIK